MDRCSNLRPFNTMTEEQRRAISSMGGKASGAARRAKRERINEIKAQKMAEKEFKFEYDRQFAREIRQLAQDLKALAYIEKIHGL